MSTKIYYAYKFNGQANELVPEFLKLKSKLLPNIRKFKIDPENPIPKEDLEDELFSIVVYFLGSDIYIQLFGTYGLMNETEKILGNKISDFHYQDQVDSENSEEEDEKRKLVWESIFSVGDIPSAVGLSYEIIKKDDILYW